MNRDWLLPLTSEEAKYVKLCITYCNCFVFEKDPAVSVTTALEKHIWSWAAEQERKKIISEAAP